MIKNLKYAVTFPTNNLSLKGDLNFQPGLTAITGENGSGKSFGSIELIRYMLFGKKALRGPASDYKTLDAEMEVEIAGGSYKIVRGPRTEQLQDLESDEVLAVGTEAVNERLLKIIGFKLEVFDIACAAVQKQSDRLSQLAPAARKRLIDEIVGLTSNELVEKACKDEAKGLAREAEGIRMGLVIPIEPEKPQGYQSADELAAELAATRSLINQATELRILSAMACPPIQPGAERPADAEIAALEESERDRAHLVASTSAAQAALTRLPVSSWTAEELDQDEVYLDYTIEVARRGQRPTTTDEEMQNLRNLAAEIKFLQHCRELEVVCPNCSKHSQPWLDRVTPTMPITAAELAAEEKAHASWAAPLVEVLGPFGLSRDEIQNRRQILARQDERPALEQLAYQAIPDGKSPLLRMLQQRAAEWKAYDRAYANWEISQTRALQAQKDLKALGAVPSDTRASEEAYVHAKVYESELAGFELAQSNYVRLSEAAKVLSRRAEEYKAGAIALSETRQLLKAHLAPALSRVASSLINQMTGGVLTSVIVDEDMNIAVDGQDIATLSGAGSTVANLALRLGLGQVLVRGIFPVFIADEADSDMSASRAQYTMECLNSLKSQLNQIIIVTHKDVEFADAVIKMGD